MYLRDQVIRFVIIGGVATSVQYAILIVLVRFASSEPVVASTIGFAISAVLNYLANRRFTFRSRARHGDAVPRFVLVALVGLLINASILAVLHDAMGLHYLVAQVAATGATLMWNFWFNRIWTFAS